MDTINKRLVKNSLFIYFVDKLNIPQDDADKLSNLNAELQFKLGLGRATFRYKKKDGTLREAEGTTYISEIPEDKRAKGIRSSSQAVQCYYDFGAEDWRCFRREMLVSMEG